MRTRTIDDYIDAARSAASLSSDRKLSIVLGITHVSVNAWRQKRAWPKDEMIIRLAELAGLDPDEALIDLNRWRAKDPTAQQRYARLLKRLQRSAAAIVLVGTATALSFANTSDANAAAPVNGTGTSGHANFQNYVLSDFRARLRRLLRRLRPHKLLMRQRLSRLTQRSSGGFASAAYRRVRGTGFAHAATA